MKKWNKIFIFILCLVSVISITLISALDLPRDNKNYETYGNCVSNSVVGRKICYNISSIKYNLCINYDRDTSESILTHKGSLINECRDLAEQKLEQCDGILETGSSYRNRNHTLTPSEIAKNECYAVVTNTTNLCLDNSVQARNACYASMSIEKDLCLNNSATLEQKRRCSSDYVDGMRMCNNASQTRQCISNSNDGRDVCNAVFIEALRAEVKVTMQASIDSSGVANGSTNNTEGLSQELLDMYANQGEIRNACVATAQQKRDQCLVASPDNTAICNSTFFNETRQCSITSLQIILANINVSNINRTEQQIVNSSAGEEARAAMRAERDALRNAALVEEDLCLDTYFTEVSQCQTQYIAEINKTLNEQQFLRNACRSNFTAERQQCDVAYGQEKDQCGVISHNIFETIYATLFIK